MSCCIGMEGASHLFLIGKATDPYWPNIPLLCLFSLGVVLIPYGMKRRAATCIQFVHLSKFDKL